jgi:hypothetical protein
LPCEELGDGLPKIDADFQKVKFVKPDIANTFQARAGPFVQSVKQKADKSDEIEGLATVIGADILKTLQQDQ